jgi:hypothetical protein
MLEQPAGTLKGRQVQILIRRTDDHLTQSIGVTSRTWRGNTSTRNGVDHSTEHAGEVLDTSHQDFNKISVGSRLSISQPSKKLQTGMREPFWPDNKAVQSSQHVQNKKCKTPVIKRKGKMQHPSRFDHAGADLLGLSPPTSSDSGTDATKPYHCTVCRNSFKDVYGWKRHESGVHGFIDTEWVCMLTDAITQGITCIFCSHIVHDLSHFDSHDIHKCLNKTICDRTFARKDLLKQHVQQVHLAAAEKPVLKAFQVPKEWSQEVEPARIHPAAVWCGFCLYTCTSVNERMKHVAEHFENGYEMQDWIPFTTIP